MLTSCQHFANASYLIAWYFTAGQLLFYNTLKIFSAIDFVEVSLY
jgi:hypothetical protein